MNENLRPTPTRRDPAQNFSGSCAMIMINPKDYIRVFPKRTSFTPDDDFAVIGEPGLFPPPERPVKISVTFTWHLNEAERLYRAWKAIYPNVDIGGPAIGGELAVDFIPGLFLKKGKVITSRGCTKDCPWCFVPKREGWIKELPITDGNDVLDNNLLACSESHIRKVFEMLKRQKEPIKLSGGLDAELLQPWHVELLKKIRLKFVWFAADNIASLEKIEYAAGLMKDFGRDKKRCYVLIGFNGETLIQAEKRLKQVYRFGFLPMAMLYQNDSMKRNDYYEFKKMQRYWSRPAIFRKHMKNG